MKRTSRLNMTILLCFTILKPMNSLSCDEILELPADQKLTITELETVEPQDIIKCLAHLGKERMIEEVANHIWQTIVNYYNGIENIPDSVLMILHWVTVAVKPEDYANMTLDNIDVIENFGLNYNLNRYQLAAIADRVREDFADKAPEDYTYYDLMAMKQILCEFNRSEIERIHPSVYREAAIMIGKLEKCEAEVMKGFATLAQNVNAFGSPRKWTKNIIDIMGKVAEYLPRDLTLRFRIEPSKDIGRTRTE